MNGNTNSFAPLMFQKDFIFTENNIDYNLDSEMNNGFIPDIRKYNQVLYTNDRNQVKTDTDDILAIKGNYETTEFSKQYFSRENLNALQEAIRYYVHQQTGTVIGEQSENELYIIMRSFLFQNGDQSVQGRDAILYEIKKLNQMVISFSVKTIVSQLSMYEKYMTDVENLVVPIDRPQYNDTQKITLGHPYV
mgnify:CR=1 FL=1